MRERRHSATRRPRTGFTLIELLVVIVILAMLVGLIVPAVMAAIKKAKEATGAAEIQALAQALADFKSKYGEFPPSRIVISESGDYSAGTLGPLAPLASRSMTAIKRYWPRVVLNTDGTKPTIPSPGFYDVNGNGTLDTTPYLLTGVECLTFFLGGIPQSTGAGWAMTGFSKNPANPFQNSTFTNNRTTALYEFNNGRLVTNTMNAVPSSTGFPGYADPLGTISNPLNPQADPGSALPFYVYFSAYGGAGYDPGDCDMPSELDLNSGQPVLGAFLAPGAVIVGTSPGTYPEIASPAPNPYTSSCPVPTDATGAAVAAATANVKPRAWMNPNSFQIISPGVDRFYGIGGQYVQNGTARLPFVRASTGYTADSLQTQQANATITSSTVQADVRGHESDNLANFAQGRLD